MTSKFTDFNLTPGEYVAFDATSLRDLIISRLNEQNIFTDQVFEGSNMSSMIDIIAYSYHVLLFYLNKTSSESMFTDASVYENMNRIVKLLNYKPVGYRTSTTPFQATATLQNSENLTGLTPGFYTIPRYSFVDVNGITYSTREDIPFDLQFESDQEIVSDKSKYILYQGKYQEHPTYSAIGDTFETMIMSLSRDVLVDHHSIDVYVRDASTGVYTKWSAIESLFLAEPSSPVYEIRLNENYRYELKFGNGITGKKLNSGDEVCVYYIQGDQSGIIGPHAMKDKVFTLYTTNKFVQIKADIQQEQTNYITLNDIQKIKLDNDTTSTDPQVYETTGDIRNNAPGYFAHQNRLVTGTDFETYIKTNYSNIISDTLVYSNKQYIDNHLRYLANDLNLTRPTLESRLLSNQVAFANSTTYNNVYVYVVPRLDAKTSVTKHSNFLSVAQKEVIKSGLDTVKSLGLEVILVDPVYMAVDLAAATVANQPNTTMIGKSALHIVKNPNIPRESAQLKLEVATLIKNYFKHTAVSLGQTVSVSELNNKILSVPGVESIYTSDGTNTSTGLSFIIWNPVYETDIAVYNQNAPLKQFQFPYLYQNDRVVDRIVID